MLRDAALLQLDLLDEALAEGFVLQDGEATNVQFHRGRPLFIDLPSFVPYESGAAWDGDRQFRRTCLNPLLLAAWTGCDFQPWLRGSVGGLGAAELARLLGPWRRWRPASLLHVVAAAALERRLGASTPAWRADLAAAGLGASVLRAGVARLRRLISGLRWSPPRSAFSQYTDEPDAVQDRAAKAEFVTAALADRQRRLILDLGANTGELSALAARQADLVVALDGDHAAVERHYLSLRAAGGLAVLPLVADLADPTPGRGWRGVERSALMDRGRPDLVLALALVHHLSITAHVPLPEVMDWLFSLAPELLVEWVDRADPRAARLLAGKRAQHLDYQRAVFDEAIARRGEVVARRELRGGSRVLLHVRRRGPGS